MLACDGSSRRAVVHVLRKCLAHPFSSSPQIDTRQTRQPTEMSAAFPFPFDQDLALPVRGFQCRGSCRHGTALFLSSCCSGRVRHNTCQATSQRTSQKALPSKSLQRLTAHHTCSSVSDFFSAIISRAASNCSSPIRRCPFLGSLCRSNVHFSCVLPNRADIPKKSAKSLARLGKDDVNVRFGKIPIYQGGVLQVKECKRIR